MAKQHDMAKMLTDGANTYGMNRRTPFSNIGATGGSNSITTNLQSIDAITPVVFNPVQIFVVHLPTMFDGIKGFNNTLKTIYETHLRNFTGIDVEYTLSTEEMPIGNDGQSVKGPSRTNRNAISPSMVMDEVNGNLIWNMHRFWIQQCQHPDTNSSYSDLVASGLEVPPHVFSSFTMSLCAIQYDATMLPDNIIDATFISLMVPTGTGPLGMQKQINTNQRMERTIPFTGYLSHNDTTRELGYRIADQNQVHNHQFSKSTIDNNNGEIDGAIKDVGTVKLAKEIIEDAVASNGTNAA